MLARVKQDYKAGPVMAFSGREYVVSEWRAVPAGFEEQARNHPLLDIQPSTDEIRAESAGLPGLGKPEPEAPPAVTMETDEPPPVEETPVETKPAEEDLIPKTPRSRRARPAKD